MGLETRIIINSSLMMFTMDVVKVLNPKDATFENVEQMTLTATTAKTATMSKDSKGCEHIEITSLSYTDRKIGHE